MDQNKIEKIGSDILDGAFAESDGLYYESPEQQQLRLQREDRNARRTEKLVSVAKRVLTPRQFEALALKQGLGEALEPRTDEEVSIIMGVNHQRVNQLYQKAVQKLQPYWGEISDGTEA